MDSGTGSPPRETFRWVECPRDAWQALPGLIDTESKRDFLRRLLAAGFRDLDLGSFVSARAVPQMADTEEVLAGLQRPREADLLCIVANLRGLARARQVPNVTTVGYPFSVNETFQWRNTGRGLEESWRLVEELVREVDSYGLNLVVYLSMGFGNPYGEPWSPGETAEAARRLEDLGVDRLALADTVGTASPQLVSDVISEVSWRGELGVHLHARPDTWPGLVTAAWQAGVRWFEGALGGVGGCPFAGDELVGNLPSEEVVPWLADASGWSPPWLDQLPELARDARHLAAEASASDASPGRGSGGPG